MTTIPKPPVFPPPEGRQGYVRGWRETDEWFDRLDADKDGKLNQEEATEYIRDFLKRTQGTDPQDALIEMEFVDMATEGFLSRQCLYDHIVANGTFAGEEQLEVQIPVEPKMPEQPVQQQNTVS